MKGRLGSGAIVRITLVPATIGLPQGRGTAQVTGARTVLQRAHPDPVDVAQGDGPHTHGPAFRANGAGGIAHGDGSAQARRDGRHTSSAQLGLIRCGAPHARQPDGAWSVAA